MVMLVTVELDEQTCPTAGSSEDSPAAHAHAVSTDNDTRHTNDTRGVRRREHGIYTTVAPGPLIAVGRKRGGRELLLDGAQLLAHARKRRPSAHTTQE